MHKSLQYRCTWNSCWGLSVRSRGTTDLCPPQLSGGRSPSGPTGVHAGPCHVMRTAPRHLNQQFFLIPPAHKKIQNII